MTIILINIVLSGDNALVMGLAAKRLPRPLRTRALIAGSACAIALLVTATLLATKLIRLKFLGIIGGGLVLWIALSPFRPATSQRTEVIQVHSLWKAMWVIIAADLVMSTDNILAIAAVAQGRLLLLLIGLGLSIPIVVFGSGLVAHVMDKHPAIIYVGASLLGRIAGEMVLTDRFVANVFSPSALLRYGIETTSAIGVPVAGMWLQARTEARTVGDRYRTGHGCKEVQA